MFEGRGGNEDEYSVFVSTYLRPVLLGATTALSSTPCATPIVAALLSQISANSGGILSASPLLLSYGLGVSAPIVIFSKLGSSAAIEVVKRTGESSVRLQKLMGLGLMTLAFYQVLVLFWGDPGLFFVWRRIVGGWVVGGGDTTTVKITESKIIDIELCQRKSK